MGRDTLISWCDSTVSATTGCGEGCELWTILAELRAKAEVEGKRPRKGGPCYAGVLHETRLSKSLPALYAPDFTEVRLISGRMVKAAAWSDLTGTTRPDKPWLDGSPRLIFVNDLGDLFSKAVPFEFIRDEVIETARSVKGRRHIWMLLTKQPRRMVEFAAWLAERGERWPDNLWAGTSVTGKATLKRLDWLLKVPARVRFASLEPLWEGVSLNDGEYLCRDWPNRITIGRYLDLVIVGGESRQGSHKVHPFDLAWARRLRDECAATGTEFHLKQLGAQPFDSLSVYPRIHLKDHHGGDWLEWPEDLRVRRMPAHAGSEATR